MNLFAKRVSAKQIAKALGIDTKTVEFHKRNIRADKFGINGNLLIELYRLGLVQDSQLEIFAKAIRSSIVRWSDERREIVAAVILGASSAKDIAAKRKTSKKAVDDLIGRIKKDFSEEELGTLFTDYEIDFWLMAGVMVLPQQLEKLGVKPTMTLEEVTIVRASFARR